MLIYLRGLGFPTDRRPTGPETVRPAAGAARHGPWGTPKIKIFEGAASRPLDKNDGMV